MTTDAELDGLLARWAGIHRLTAAQAEVMHAAILRETTVEFDADWLLGLLRPVTSLLDGPNGLNVTLAGLISVGA